MSRIFFVYLQTFLKDNMFKRFIINITLILLLLSCKTIQYVEKEIPVEVVKTEYIYQEKLDSVYIHDSINMYIKGDTIYKDKIRYYYKTIIQRDTVNLTDSIPVVVHNTEIKEVNKLRWYQKYLMYLGIASLILIILYIVIKIIKWKL